jgi:hypothetical protein
MSKHRAIARRVSERVFTLAEWPDEDDKSVVYLGMVNGLSHTRGMTKEKAEDWLANRRAELEDIVFDAIYEAAIDSVKVSQLKLELEGERKANALWAKGMESQCELMDSMKQELRALKKENAALKPHPPGPEGGGL